MSAPDLTMPNNISQYARMLGAQMLPHAPTVGAAIGAMAGIIFAMTSTAGLSLTLTAALTVALPTLTGAAVGYITRTLLRQSRPTPQEPTPTPEPQLTSEDCRKKLTRTVVESFLNSFKEPEGTEHPLRLEPKVTLISTQGESIVLYLPVPEPLQKILSAFSLNIKLKDDGVSHHFGVAWKEGVNEESEKKTLKAHTKTLREKWEEFDLLKHITLEELKTARSNNT